MTAKLYPPSIQHCAFITARHYEHSDPHPCAFMERQEKELCAFAARKYKHSDPECCACTTRQDFLPLQQDKIQTYLPIRLENMNTTTQNFVPLQQDKTKTFVCLRQKNTNTMTSNFVP